MLLENNCLEGRKWYRSGEISTVINLTILATQRWLAHSSFSTVIMFSYENISKPSQLLNISHIYHLLAPPFSKTTTARGWDSWGVAAFWVPPLRKHFFFAPLVQPSGTPEDRTTIAARRAPRCPQGMAAIKRNRSSVSQCPCFYISEFELTDFCCCWWCLKIKCYVQQQMLVISFRAEYFFTHGLVVHQGPRTLAVDKQNQNLF